MSELISEVDERLGAVLEDLILAKIEFEIGTKCCAEAIGMLHERLERIEKWMEKEKRRKALVTPITGGKKGLQKRHLKP